MPLSVLATAKYLVLDLFAGMDGLGHALELNGVTDLQALGVVIIFFEVDSRCRRLLRTRRVKLHSYLSDVKDSEGAPGSVFALSDAEFFLLNSLLDSCPMLQLLFVGGGSPCVGFSAANPRGRGVNDPASNMIWTIPVLAARARQRLPATVSVVFFLENVDMPGSRKPPLDEIFGVSGVKACASLYGPCNRPREFWTNLPIHLDSASTVDPPSVLDKGWKPLWELLGTSKSRPKFCTFLRPFPPGRPQEFSVAFTRLPLSMYSEFGLVYRPDSSKEALSKLKDLVLRCARCDTHDLKTVGGSAVKLRGELCEYTHSSNYKVVRPLNGRERDLCLGFPPNASSLPGEEADLSMNWDRLSATGNSYSVPVVACIVRALTSAIKSGSVPLLLPGMPSVLTPAAALSALGASSSAPLRQGNSGR